MKNKREVLIEYLNKIVADKEEVWDFEMARTGSAYVHTDYGVLKISNHQILETKHDFWGWVSRKESYVSMRVTRGVPLYSYIENDPYKEQFGKYFAFTEIKKYNWETSETGWCADFWLIIPTNFNLKKLEEGIEAFLSNEKGKL